MKVTSYLISKKLAKIGFKADFDWCYGKNDQDKSGVWSKSFEITCWESEDISNYYPAYDLETMLDALPKKNWDIKNNGEQISILPAAGRARIVVVRKINESLADTAARLLIQLYEAGIVKFKEE